MAANKRISSIFRKAPVSSGLILLLLTTSGLGVVALVVIAAIWAGTESDAAALDRQRQLVNTRLLDQVERVSHEVRLMNAGLDTLLRANDDRTRLDMTPVEFRYQDSNKPTAVASFRELATNLFGYDAAFVVASDGSMPFDTDTSIVKRFRWIRPLIQPMMDDLQEQLQIVEASDWGALKDVPSRAELLRIEGRPAVAGVVPVKPSTSSQSKAPTKLYLIAFRFLDGKALDTLSREQGLIGARYARASDQELEEVAFQIEATSTREPIGFIIWEPDLPGTRVIGRLTPMLSLAAITFLALFLALIIGIRRSMKKLTESELYARHLANHDVLTGLANRAMFNERLNQCLSVEDKHPSVTDIALALIDLDKFKQVNDEHGHPVGDELLLKVVNRIEGIINEDHTLARLGGDEFALLFPSCALDGSAGSEICQTIIEALSEPFSLKLDSVKATIGCSIGIVHGRDARFDQIEMLRCADLALYEAKSHGRGRLINYDRRMDLQVQERDSLRSDLQILLQEPGLQHQAVALKDVGQLEVYLQGVHAAGGHGALTCAEALVRWQHPQHGLLTPARFIQIAEDSGLIDTLGHRVLQEAIGAAATWSSAISVAVNVSPSQIRKAGFASQVKKVLVETGLPPHRLELEVTEAALLSSEEITTANLRSLRSIGVKIALDDFGTGFSSLSHLINFDVDRIKIDKSFVDLIGTRAEGTAIVSAIIALSKSLGKAVTAEGVETVGQRDFLVALGCTDLQGYLLSRPVPQHLFSRQNHACLEVANVD
ncbi:EAL domain-containing protein [Agrobacterium sp. CG674]